MMGWVTPPAPKVVEQKRELSPEQLDEIRHLFSIYDTDRSGGISVRELKDALKGTFLGDGEVEEMFTKADLDENALLDLEEFKKLMVSTGLWDADAPVDAPN